ncbi:MAG: hypothetical protein P1U58_09645 [Verrucomicrobiales bacterium]|nr:hypothetical protein [Verrucomicrobiales bacterium]
MAAHKKGRTTFLDQERSRKLTTLLSRIYGIFWHDKATHPYTLCRIDDLTPSVQPINNMKKLIATLAVAILALAPAAMAGEVTYIAGMTGVT